MPRVQVETNPGASWWELYKGLAAFNAQALGETGYGLLTVTLREDEAIVGGLVGSIWLDWLSIDLLWVAEAYRGKRHGTALMEMAETEARKQGIRNVFLNSFSFQAPGFYEKLGYRQFGRLDEFPAGHSRYWFTKAL